MTKTDGLSARILVVGDLMIDRSWLVAQDRPGPQYPVQPPYQRTNVGFQTDVLGGAGRTARLIADICSPSSVTFLSRWGSGGSHLIGVGQMKWLRVKTSVPDYNTAMKLRVFESDKGAQPTLLARYDDENTTPEASTSLVQSESSIVGTTWPSDVDLIVVHSFEKGLATPAFLSSLLARFPEARWIVDAGDPDLKAFLVSLGERLLCLVAHPEELASMLADTGSRQPYESSLGLLPETGRLDRETTNLLIKATSEFTAAIVVPMGNYAVSALNVDGESQVVIGDRLEWPRTCVGGQSAFLTSIVRSVLYKDSAYTVPKDAKERILRSPSEFSYLANQWHRRQEKVMAKWGANGDTLLDPKFSSNDEPLLRVSGIGSFRFIDGIARMMTGEPTSLAAIRRQWELSTEERVLSDDYLKVVGREIQMWRAQGFLNPYLTVNEDLGRVLVRMREEFGRYLLNPSMRRPLVSLLWAQPGSGKSFLAECLARSLNIEFVEANVSQLDGPSDLTDYFDVVRNNSVRSKVSLLVVDEIDTDEDFIPYLLAPLWSGKFERNGSKFDLGKCIVLCILSAEGVPATTDSAEVLRELGNRLGARKKMTDFISRVNGPVASLPTPSKADQVYLAASIIHQRLGVVEVELGVLLLARDATLMHGVRSLEQLFSGSNLPRGGVLRVSDVQDAVERYKEIQIKLPPTPRRGQGLDWERQHQVIRIAP